MKRTTFNHWQFLTAFLTFVSSPTSTLSLAATRATTRGTTTTKHFHTTSNSSSMKKRILCLHGKFQSGAILSNKIAGARRKLARVYELDFLNGPMLLNTNEENSFSSSSSSTIGGGCEDDALEQKDTTGGGGPVFAWFSRELQEDGVSFKYSGIQEAFDYILKETNGISYDALIGFSQGGTVATALAASGALPSVKAVVTAGAPLVEEAFDVAMAAVFGKNNDRELLRESGLAIPKLHLAGEADAMVSVESNRRLCERGGNGQLIVHEQGHLFPTRAARVNHMMDFLEQSLAAQT
jgi:pimeloyl-ACP methyl ester carboxylesterase